MRVLHIGKFFPPYAGGIERYCAELAAAQAASGIATAMLAHASPGERSREFRSDGVEVTLAACYGQLLYAPVSPAFPHLLARRIGTFKPDLLHLHMPNTSAFWALLWPAARRLPWVVHWHADIPLDSRRRRLRMAYRLYRPWEQALLKRARAVIATSAPYLDSSDALRPWRDKVRVVPLGIPAGPPQLIAPTALSPVPLWPASGLRVLAVGRLSYYKGFDVLLRAIADAPDAQLLLIGSGEHEEALHAQARDLGLTSRVRFAGHVDEAMLERAYTEADAFCLPSTERAEAFGLVLLEAMRARLPVIASAISGSGVGYVVRDRETGLLVVPGDVPALVQAIRRLAADPALRQRLGDAGRQRWREEFTLDQSAQRIQQVYCEVLGANPPRATVTPTT